MKAQPSETTNNRHTPGTAAALWAVAVLFTLLSCNAGGKKGGVDLGTRDSISSITTTGVVTLVSDSGRISYCIKAQEWEIFDKLAPAMWTFEKGIYLEQYNDSMQVTATIEADTAYYYYDQKLWKLVSNVRIDKIGESKVRTSLLYWDQNSEKVYSDEYTEIEQDDKLFWGNGFTSRQDFSRLEIKELKGIIPVKEEEQQATSPTDSTAQAMPQAQDSI